MAAEFQSMKAVPRKAKLKGTAATVAWHGPRRDVNSTRVRPEHSRCAQDVVHGESIAERHCAIVPHLKLTAEQRQHLVALRAAYLVRSAQVQRQREAAAQLLATALPMADFMSQVC